ncbi:hypothetical protein [Paenibacillus periandrae]|uniref:hypothetical protein n=1 Tax=Paenibacillus periandrae TaxID=1761741 RepID=UPI001F096CF1|nr:hypothetical protein [Paenibacillus periandrae]
MKSGSIEEMVNNSIDDNYLDEASQRQGYIQNLQEEKLKDFQIVSSKSIDENTAEIKVIETFETIKTPKIAYKAIKVNNQWKIHVEPFEIKLDGSVVKGTPKYKVKKLDEKQFSTLATGLVGYSMNNLGSSQSLTGSTKFNISQNQITFNGWQSCTSTSCDFLLCRDAI